MCGICGFVADKRQEEGVIRRMNNTLNLRGPDSEGFYVQNGVALAMRRLSIIDLEGGDQPVYSQRKSSVIVFNGEIYNYKVLRKNLASNGYRFYTNSDTEVILAGYEMYGLEFFKKLNGMFAIAIFDRNIKKLILVRDRIGIKPLFYTKSNGSFIFASEIKAILEHPDYYKDINIEALQSLFTYKYNPGNETVFKGIKKVKPGHYLVIDQYGKIEKIECYGLFTGKINKSLGINSIWNHFNGNIFIGQFPQFIGS